MDALPMSVRRRVRFYRAFGRWPSLRNPKSYNEKVTWRILYDRRELLADTCDKARMKAHAERTAPPGIRIAPVLWQGTDLRELADVDLPEHWVLKPNHRTGLVYFGSGRPDLQDLLMSTTGWLEPVEWLEGGEWAYSQADASFIVERRLGRPDEQLTDYKLFVYDGVVRFVKADTDRFTQRISRLYSLDWQLLAVARGSSVTGDEVPRPATLETMVEAAAAIGAGFDFIRVDFYECDGEVWFGELTPYPGSGLVGWEPYSVELEMGRLWRLPERR